jgi:DNA-binding transcriptional MerR regulator
VYGLFVATDPLEKGAVTMPSAGANATSPSVTGMKVGELARRTGVTVRTLHHYDEIGLLSPSHHTESGYRLYVAADVARLQQVMSLRQLGFSLEEIRTFLARSDASALRVIELHLARLEEQIARQHTLRDRLARIADSLRSTGWATVEQFIQVTEGITMFEKYYTPEQLEELKQRRETVGEDRIREVEAEWPRLMAEVRAEMDKGTDPADERVQELARRWSGLVNEFTGGNPGIAKSLNMLYRREPVVHGMETGPMREMGEYISKALAASKGSE